MAKKKVSKKAPAKRTSKKKAKKASKKSIKKIEKVAEDDPFKHMEPVRNLFGRPTKLNLDLIKAAYAYIDRPFYEEYEEEVVVAGVGIQTLVKQRPSGPPTVAGLAGVLSVARETLYDWGRKNDTFSDIMKSLDNKRQEFILEHGLKGGYNSAFSKFVMINTSEFVEKKEVHHKADDDGFKLAYNLDNEK